MFSRNGESFGQVAQEQEKLTEAQVRRITQAQKKYNSRIGTYFVCQGMLSEKRIERCHDQFREHNSIYAG